ncbi:hypothetical protein MHUMG1_10629 [Metarhizium humberi]|uniref:Kinesin light chain n=1 Tax=Metarhizium humberi TaxID=2596975 RepID=A0A9P8M118_9HYPO|nr:hypothetical protein MHUMG1_10629 [Metarhizium humberi]
MEARIPLSNNDYTVGWICALPVETAAATLMLDKIHPLLPRLPMDDNTYILGSIREHNVVIASLPSGAYGHTSAATVGMQLLSSFPAVRIGLMVGIGGGVPSSNVDIRLGDIVVSQPLDTFGGVIQYDLGKVLDGAQFKRTGTLNRPPKVLLTALATLQARHLTEDSRVIEFVSKAQAKIAPHKTRRFVRPTQEDCLFQAEYDHVASDTCMNCDRSKLIPRSPRKHQEPVIHYGLIGSANQMVRDGMRRDQLARDLGIYCVEMEAAGLMNDFPCLVIRGICDYADSHKNKEWQGYAAVVAAAYAKELLSVVPIGQINSTATARATISDSGERLQISTCVQSFSVPLDLPAVPAIENFWGRQDELDKLWQHLQPTSSRSRKVAILHGLEGIGKTQLAIRFAQDHKHDFTAIIWLSGKDRGTLLRSLSSILPRLPGQSQNNEAVHDEEVEQRARHVLRWLALEGNSRWLIIFDNIDQYSPTNIANSDADNIGEFFPPADHGSILLTSRLQKLTELGKSFPINKLDPDDAIELLMQSSHSSAKNIITRSGSNPDTLSFDPPTVAHFMVPFERDKGFVDRSDIFSAIEDYFKAGERAALAGIGGVGKSQIAIEYCYRFREDFPYRHVFWIHSATRYRIYQTCKKIAQNLCLPGCNNPNADMFEVVSQALTSDTYGGWLIILDNADDVETFFNSDATQLSGKDSPKEPLAYSLPRGSHGRTLITTRDKTVGEMLTDSTTIKVNPMSHGSAEALFLSKVAQPSQNTSRVGQLLKTVDYVPLAITQAAAYIRKNDLDIEEYIEILHKDDSEIEALLSKDFPNLRRDSKSQNSIIRTWKVSFDAIRRRWKLSADLLSLMAVLDRQGIPKRLLKRDSESHTEFLDNIGTLQAFSLISADRQRATFNMHRLVQIATRMWLEMHGETTKWREEALTMLHARFPRGDYENWEICQGAYPHADAVTRHTFVPGLDLLRAKVLYNMASFDEVRGQYGLAFSKCSAAVNIQKSLLGVGHPDTLATMYLTALIHWHQGRYAEAERIQRETLELRANILGPDHPDTLKSMSNIGNSLLRQGRYEAAQEMHRRTLELRQNSLGLTHPDTLKSMNNVANSLYRLKQYEPAERTHRQTLALRESVLEPGHPDIFMSMSNLANSLDKQGKHAAAEDWHRRTLELRGDVLGSEHPDALKSMQGLANSLRKQGRSDAAREIYRKTLELREKALGPAHPDTIATRSDLRSLEESQYRNSPLHW